MRKIPILFTVLSLILTLTLIPFNAYAFTPSPRTAYAREFISKCDGQQWFIDEVERIMNVQEKTLNTIKSRADFEYIVSFGLKSKSINGVLPRAFGELYNLRSIFLADNRLTGGIPSEIFTLSKLENLDLSNNLLSGAIPPGIGSLTALKVLLLWQNNFSGGIPTEIGNLANLVNLDLADNKLTGQVPGSIGNLGNLRILCLSNNLFDTVIPDSFANMSALKALLMWNTGVKGTIPPGLGNLSNLQIFDVADNSLTGGIPASFGQLANLEKLAARNNSLNIGLPQELGNMGKLEILDLANNNIPGGIPASFGGLTKLMDFTANNNLLEGAIPQSLGGLGEITIFNLAYNHLTGSIPQTLEGMAKTETFLLNNNMLEGAIPSIFSNWVDLKTVNLSNNTLVGDAPRSLRTKQRAGATIDLRSNYLAGDNLKNMDMADDNFVDGLGAGILQHRMLIQENMQLEIGQPVNIYALFGNYDAATNQPSAKAKLPVSRYSYIVVSGNAAAVQLSSDAQGFYVKAVGGIASSAPVIIEITITGDEGNPYPTTRIKLAAGSPFDLNGDGIVDINDVTYALKYFGCKSSDPGWNNDMARADFNNDGIIDIEDLILILSNYTQPYY